MTGESIFQLGSALRAMTAHDTADRDTREEALWIARAKAGEDAAYRWLLDRYRGRVVRLAAHVLRRDSEAGDVSQAAFLITDMVARKRVRSIQWQGSQEWCRGHRIQAYGGACSFCRKRTGYPR